MACQVQLFLVPAKAPTPFKECQYMPVSNAVLSAHVSDYFWQDLGIISPAIYES